MITNVITIGSDAACDFVINQFTKPMMDSYFFERILPIHAQILEEDNQYYILPFSDYISINGNYINNSSLRKKMVLNIEDRISIGVFDLFWQQWIAGLGLCCEKCLLMRCNSYKTTNNEHYTRFLRCRKCNNSLSKRMGSISQSGLVGYRKRNFVTSSMRKQIPH